MNKRTSSVFRVDEQAYLTMGAVCVIALVVLAFRYGTSHPCYPIKVVSSAATFAVGSPISFRAETRVGKTFEWNFGDGVTVKEYDPRTIHTYTRAGKYTVVISVDGQCSEMQAVIIGEAPVAVNSNIAPSIIGSDTAYVGKPVSYEDGSPSSTSWAWHFESSSMVDAYSRRASHTYTTAGIKNIILVVNHRPDLTQSRPIIVIDPKAVAEAKNPPKGKGSGNGHPNRPVIVVDSKPTEQPLTQQTQEPAKKEDPKPVAAPTATDDKLQSMLLQVVDGTMVQDDFAPYLCNNLNITIQYNGAKTTFSAMCADLKTQKRKKIKKITVTQTKAEGTNCILSLVVTVQKNKGFLGL
jgi:PKD repeat protein